MFRRLLVATLLALLTCLSSRDARAFCGFYVSGADTKLLAEATQVVLMREGTRTVLSMQNDYKGPPEGFAMVVPVPVVLQEENVKTLRRDVFERVDRLSAPRLVEYWEQDPCPSDDDHAGLALSGVGAGGGGRGFGTGSGRLGGAHVVVEAQFEVGEYEIVILSAKDSSGLDAWLRDNKYKIPDNAEPALRPYVEAGSKFFVAKVNVAKVKFENGRVSLSPLRFHYDSEKFELPVRLGMLNSSGTQDLIVHILAPNQRFAVTNYPSVTIPTNLDVTEAARTSFPAFYAALLDRTLEKNPSAIVTEYAWPSSSCDPCPGGISGLSQSDLATLGADVLPSTKVGIAAAVAARGAPSIIISKPVTTGALNPDVVHRTVRPSLGAFRFCYEKGLQNNANLQGRVQIKIDIDPAGSVSAAKDAGSDIPDTTVVDCAAQALRRLSFPKAEDKKASSAVVTLVFNTPTGASPVAPLPAGARPGGGRFGGFRSAAGSFVLTRLHARYAKDTLGNDLVFKEAPAIVGGREVRPNGSLETGAVPAAVNSFQARYAIRHEWTGAITCKEPRRGVWGGPWPDAGTRNSAPLAAQKLAYAPRGSLVLASFVPSGVPELAVGGGGAADGAAAGASGSADAGAGAAPPPTSSAPASRCGCRVVGGSQGRASWLAGLTLVVVTLARYRRRARASAT